MSCNQSAIVQCLPSSSKSGGASTSAKARGGGSSRCRRLLSVLCSVASSRPADVFPSTSSSAASSRCPPPVFLRHHLPRVSSTLTGSAATLPPLPDEVERLVYIERATGIVAADGAVVLYAVGPSSSAPLHHRPSPLRLDPRHQEPGSHAAKKIRMKVEKKEKEEDEHILSINLDHCQPIQRLCYQGLQEDVLEKMMA